MSRGLVSVVVLCSAVTAGGGPSRVAASEPAPAAVGRSSPNERATVDLERRVVRCSGVAAPALREETENVAVTRERTVRAAKAKAVDACVAALRQVPLGRGTIGERLDADPRLARDVAAVVRSARPADGPQLLSDGGAALRLVIPLDGRLSKLLAGTPAWTGAEPVHAGAEPVAPPARP